MGYSNDMLERLQIDPKDTWWGWTKKELEKQIGRRIPGRCSLKSQGMEYFKEMS